MRRATILALPLFLGFWSATAWADERLRIEIEGIEDDLRRNVLATLSLEEAREEGDLTADQIRRLESRSEEEIAEALQPFGYYRPEIESTLRREGDTWVARYEVDPGPPLQVTSVGVSVEGAGAETPGFRQAVRDFPLSQGERLYHPAYESGKQAFLDEASENGYLDAAFEVSEIRIDREAYTADIALRFDTGPRYQFGPVTFNQDFLEPDLLRGYVTFEPGEPFDLDELLRMQTALSDSPYFQRVEVVPRRDLAEGVAVPVEVNLTPAKRQRWNTGVGYGTDTGARGTVALELRRINREGHRGYTEIRAAERENAFEARYEIPGAYPRTDLLTFSLGYSDLRLDTTESETYLIGAALTRTRGEWREAFALRFQQEDYKVGVDEGTAELLIPQATWTRVRADDRISTSRGYRMEFVVRAADEAALSNASFFQTSAEGKLIRSFADRFRLVSRLRIGHTETQDFRELPATIRFFAGGDQSVRGWGYQELGPRDLAGNVIGGRELLAGSLELEYRFLEKWRFLEQWGIAVFYDAGNALRSFSDPLERGAGVGFRWVTPIGPLRADAAWALTQPGTPIRFHLTVGPDL